MGKKLYVGNLDWSITSEDLAEFFSPAGTVIKADVIRFRDSGKSKGFGFIQMETEQQTEEVLKMDGLLLKERKVIIREATPEGTRNKEGGIKRFFDFINDGNSEEIGVTFTYKEKNYRVERIDKILTE